MELIPAIDLMDGKCVRLTKGDFTKKTIYNDNPLEVAKAFEDAGLTRLHIVDLDGANGNSLKNISVLENISKHTKLIIDFGGGLKATDDIKRVFDSGASMVSLGSMIIKNPVLFSSWLVDFGADKFLPGADVLDKKIKIHGWKEDAGIDIFEFINSLNKQNIKAIFLYGYFKRWNDARAINRTVQRNSEILSWTGSYRKWWSFML